jgi:PKD repeat protein
MAMSAKASGRASSIHVEGLRLSLGLTAILVIASCGGGSSHSTSKSSGTPPTANAGGPYAADATQTIAFDGSKSTDPNNLSLSYAWNFGDNHTGTGVNATHAYTESATYNVSLVVTDSDQLTSSTATVIATITALPSASAGGPYTSTTGQGIVFDGSKSSTPDGTALTYAWTFGDGATGSGVKPTHTYAASGTFDIGLTVTDIRGGTNSASTTVTISRVIPPQLVQTTPANGATNVKTSADIVVTFSKAIDPKSVNAASFSLVDNKATAAVAGAIQLDVSGITATFVPSQPLASGDSFSVTLTTAITDLAGNHLAGKTGFGFSTGPQSYEADSLTFSVLNGTAPPGSAGATAREADSLTFSVLNGTPPFPAQPTASEVDSITFSVHNTAPSSKASASHAGPAEPNGREPSKNSNLDISKGGAGAYAGLDHSTD